MDFYVNEDSHVDVVNDNLKEYGLSVIEGYLEDVSGIKEEVDKILSETPEDDYSFGKAARIGSFVGHEHSNPWIFKFFSQAWMMRVFMDYMSARPTFNELFITHEYKGDVELARNAYLHFDRIHTFKFMLYLTDVDEQSGPFSVIPGTHLDGKFLRERTWEGTKEYEELKNRPLLDYPELGYKQEDVVPITGKAGTVIIFDSDLFHMGGIVPQDKERMLIRSHYRI